MIVINERLIEAARAGCEEKIKALLMDPRCDALTKGSKGWTSLMWAVYCGHEACVRLLLPKSDVLAKDEAGRTSSYWAKKGGHESLARFLEAYELSLTEQASIEVAASSGALRKQATPRV